MYRLEETEVFAKWLRRLKNRDARARIFIRLQRLEQGHMGDVKSLGDGVSELRMTFGAGYRIYFVQRGTKIILLLCGGDKSSQVRDIERAKLLKRELNDDR